MLEQPRADGWLVQPLCRTSPRTCANIRNTPTSWMLQRRA